MDNKIYTPTLYQRAIINSYQFGSSLLIINHHNNYLEIIEMDTITVLESEQIVTGKIMYLLIFIFLARLAIKLQSMTLT